MLPSRPDYHGPGQIRILILQMQCKTDALRKVLPHCLARRHIVRQPGRSAINVTSDGLDPNCISSCITRRAPCLVCGGEKHAPGKRISCFEILHRVRGEHFNLLRNVAFKRTGSHPSISHSGKTSIGRSTRAEMVLHSTGRSWFCHDRWFA